jgi:hypothetical protein
MLCSCGQDVGTGAVGARAGDAALFHDLKSSKREVRDARCEV